MKQNYLEEKEYTEKFVDSVKEQLSSMNEKEKDRWILNQAVILYPSKRSDFLKTLRNEKIIIDMPDDEEFKKFCDDVNSGKLYIEYETWYQRYEDGFYIDDWKEKFYDSCGIMAYIDNVFEICHQLNILGYYDKVYEYIQSIMQLEFHVEDTLESEMEFDEGYLPFTIDVIYKYYSNDLLHSNKERIIYDWIYSYCHKDTSLSYNEKALELLNMFLKPLSEEVVPSDFNCIDKEMIEIMLTQLQQLLKNHTTIYNKYSKDIYSDKKYQLGKIIERENQLFDDLKLIS